MKTELVDISPTRKEIKIEIDAADVRAAYEHVSADYTRRATVPGFRPGRAPASIVKRHYKDAIRSDVLRQLVPTAVADAIEQSALRPLGEPDIHMENQEGLNQLGEGPISLHAHVEVLPEFDLGDYKGLEVVRYVRQVTDEEVDRAINQMREKSAALLPVEDRGAQAGDIVTVNFHGKFIEPPGEEDLTAEEVDVVLGGEGVLPEFTAHLTGVTPDEERQFTVRYPADFSSKGLAGKEVAYTAKVVAVRIKELPELDDEWAQSLEQRFESVAALREHMRNTLTEAARRASDSRLRDDIITKLIEKYPIEVPQTLLQNRVRQLLESTLYDMYRSGVDPRQSDVNWEALRESLTNQAVGELRGSIILERIAEKEEIHVTDEEIAEEIKATADSLRLPYERVHAALTKDDGERSIADRLRMRKTLNLLIENARITEEEWRDEPAQDAPAEAASEPSAAVSSADEPRPDATSSSSAEA
jgi:trigger factor